MFRFTTAFIYLAALCLAVLASTSEPSRPPKITNVTPKPPTTGVPVSPGGNTCPRPTAEVLRCMREWACQYLVNLDLRCLLNLNGNPLLGNLLGSGGGVTGGAGATGGILNNLLSG